MCVWLARGKVFCAAPCLNARFLFALRAPLLTVFFLSLTSDTSAKCPNIPQRYQLTDAGTTLARKLRDTASAAADTAGSRSGGGGAMDGGRGGTSSSAKSMVAKPSKQAQTPHVQRPQHIPGGVHRIPVQVTPTSRRTIVAAATPTDSSVPSRPPPAAAAAAASSSRAKSPANGNASPSLTPNNAAAFSKQKPSICRTLSSSSPPWQPQQPHQSRQPQRRPQRTPPAQPSAAAVSPSPAASSTPSFETGKGTPGHGCYEVVLLVDSAEKCPIYEKVQDTLLRDPFYQRCKMRNSPRLPPLIGIYSLPAPRPPPLY